MKKNKADKVSLEEVKEIFRKTVPDWKEREDVLIEMVVLFFNRVKEHELHQFKAPYPNFIVRKS